jgi:sortase A
MPTRIVIPSISVDAPVVPAARHEVRGQETTLAWLEVPRERAAGWYEASAALGVAGNTVLSGHNTGYGEVFRDLYTLDAGDTVIVYADDMPYMHTVSETLVLVEAGETLEARRRNAHYIEPTDDERVTLVTCHPYGSLRYRLIVIARPGVVVSGRWSWRTPLEE